MRKTLWNTSDPQDLTIIACIAAAWIVLVYYWARGIL